jgi:thiol-disulfide isomerase/thioredoxin
MDKKKRLAGFIIVLVVVVGFIWYLEAMKVSPGGGAGSGTSIAIPSGIAVATGTQPTASGTTTGTVGTATPAQVQQAIQAIALADQKAGYKPALEIVDPTGFVNASSDFTLSSLVGKDVILLDFWTYSCINCIRTIPYLNSWYQKYHADGLQIVGIHTPEFDFEKDITNVQTAVRQYGIQYPVILDSNYGTWDAYGNLYWPEGYLIDMAGYVVSQDIGEGNYDAREAAIQNLLKERAQVLGLPTPTAATTTVAIPTGLTAGPMSPETYFGAERNDTLANGSANTPGVQMLTAPASTEANALYLAGTWDFEDQYATNKEADARVIFEYQASKVYFVASAPTGATIQVLQDGQPLSAADSGSDVKNGVLTVGASRLYSVVNNADGSGIHTLELIIQSPGLQAYTFTFG